MAHDGTGVNWDETAPADTDVAKNGAKEVRDLRKGVNTRLQYEHTPAIVGGGFKHKRGSARAFYQPTPAPTKSTDGVTSLGGEDTGRLWVEPTTSVIYFWTGSAWKPISIASGVVLTADMVQTASIKNEAVTTPKIAKGAITADRLAPQAVTAHSILDGTITGAKLANQSIPTTKLAPGLQGAAPIATLVAETAEGVNPTLPPGFTNGVWFMRPLILKWNRYGVVQQWYSSGQFQVAAGRYRVRAGGCGHKCGRFKICLYDGTAGSIISRGTVASSAAGDDTFAWSTIDDEIELTRTTVLSMSQIVGVAAATAWGASVGTELERTAYLSIEKVP